jgi:hypothetical protein
MTETTIDDVAEGDDVEFEFTTKLKSNRVSRSGTVVEAGGDLLKVKGDRDDPLEGDCDVFILQGEPGKLKNVYYKRSGERDSFLGDRARLT